VEVLEDRADGRLALVQERGQVGVELVDGSWAGLEGGEDLPVASGEPFLREQPVEALVDQAVDQLQPEADGTPVGRNGGRIHRAVYLQLHVYVYLYVE
jgi:hypothetical protein